MDVIMPQLGETVAEGKVAAWFKAPGDPVEAGERLFEVETDKVTMEVQALASGRVAEIRVREGESAEVGAVVAVIGEAAAEARGHADARPSAASHASPAAAGGWPFRLAPFAETATPARNFGKVTGPLGVKVTPLARRLIATNGVDLAVLAGRVKAEGAWRIGRAEVEAALADGARPAHSPAGSTAAVPEAERSRIPFNAVRRQTGEALLASWRTIPHAFQAMEVDFSAVEKARTRAKADFAARTGTPLTYLPFVARAVCIAIAGFPHVNARVEEGALSLSADVHLGIAVDLAHAGLVVPVVRHADEMTVAGLARAIAGLSERARRKALSPDDLSGATYTITNNGVFGTLLTAPIVKAPQVAILSTDAVRKRPVVVSGDDGDAIAIRAIGVIGQSFDHRAFDGAYAAAFLGRVKAVLETRDWADEVR
jgi:pyruvate/2-oxoglutarate dehydrogenase complex dihydrolipoamide acyltransferase (E2) component